MSYENSFWDTRRGVELAEVLIHTLPDLSKRKVRQEVITAKNTAEEVRKAIANEEEKGYLLHVSNVTSDGYAVLVFRKEG